MIAMLIGLVAMAESAAQPLPVFLAGCWEQVDGKAWSDECWTGPRGGTMIGSARMGTGDALNHWEWMRIERGADGALTFYASPRGAPASGFKAALVSANEVVFVNPAHDYPQRVRYLKTAEGLEAEISLADGSKTVRWRYRRTGSATK